jgi:hypothetical protein
MSELDREDIEVLLAASEIDEKFRQALAPKDLARYSLARDKLRAALSSSPEQGGEERRWKGRRFLLGLPPGIDHGPTGEYGQIIASLDNLAPGWEAIEVAPIGDLREAEAKAQTPAPALSDEERERLNQIATRLEEIAMGSGYPEHEQFIADADLLRTLASQEQGETGELQELESELARTRLALQNVAEFNPPFRIDKARRAVLIEALKKLDYGFAKDLRAELEATKCSDCGGGGYAPYVGGDDDDAPCLTCKGTGFSEPSAPETEKEELARFFRDESPIEGEGR